MDAEADALKRTIKELDCEALSLKTELEEMQHQVDVKMSRDKLLYDRMVANYHRMEAECEERETQLRRLDEENRRYETIARHGRN